MKKQETINMCCAFLDEHNIAYSLYEEGGETVGIEMEIYTDAGCDMLHLIDGRWSDMTDPRWWAEELESIYNNFDAEEETKLHLECPDNPGLRVMIRDFDEHDAWLKELSESALQYVA